MHTVDEEVGNRVDFGVVYGIPLSLVTHDAVVMPFSALALVTHGAQKVVLRLFDGPVLVLILS